MSPPRGPEGQRRGPALRESQAGLSTRNSPGCCSDYPAAPTTPGRLPNLETPRVPGATATSPLPLGIERHR